MAKDIWQSKDNPNEFFGTNEDLTEFNKVKGGTLLVENQQAFEMFSKGEPLVMPSTSPVKKEPKKKVVKNKKVTNIAALQNGKEITLQVREAEPEQPMTMPAVVIQENQLGYSSPSLVKTGDSDTDPLSKMRECGKEEENEEGNPMPSVVAKKDEK